MHHLNIENITPRCSNTGVLTASLTYQNMLDGVEQNVVALLEAIVIADTTMSQGVRIVEFENITPELPYVTTRIFTRITHM